jgi:plastocyanin
MKRVLRAAAVPLIAALVLLPGAGATARHATGTQTFIVNVDGTPKSANLGFDAYFPKATTIHAGDTVKFHWAGVGEPHTTTFGTYANAAVLAYNRLTPAQQQSNAPPKAFLAIDARVPNLLPQGPGDATQSVSNPCYQQNGSVGTGVCPNSQHQQPDFNGTQVYYNSGWPDSGQNWSITFSTSTAAGQYRFMCALHRESMAGKITVAAAGKTIMSPSAQFAIGQKQLAAEVAQIAKAVPPTRQGNAPVPGVTVPGANHVLAGSGLPNGSGSIDEFGPRTIKIPVGGSVTWWVIGAHSITFNSDKSNDDIRKVAPDGTVHLNPVASAPAGGPGQPNTPPSNAKGITFKLAASAKWNGSGFFNTGIWASFPPAIQGYKLTFTKAGTYHYICVVHDNMKGTVVVG